MIAAADIRTMLERQADAWKTGDFSAAAADWHPEGLLTAPGNKVPFNELEETIRRFHGDYGDLEVTITNIVVSADVSKIALEWLWAVTRRSDNARSVTEDAIIVDLENGLIKSWREYFDTASAVETHHK